MGRLLQRLQRFFRELRRRNVYKVAVTYAAVAFVAIQVANLLVPETTLPGYADALLVYLTIFGFPIAVVLAWAFEITPEGIQRTPAEPLPSVEDDHVSDLLRRVPHPGRAGADPGGPGEGGGVGLSEREEPSGERVRRASLAHLRHDLRTPTGVVVGYTEMLLEDAREAGWEEIVPQLENLHAAGEELRETVEAALDPEHGDPPEDAGTRDPAGRFRYELRDHLNAVIGYGELVLDECRESSREELLPDLKRVLEASRQLLDRSDEFVELFSTDGDITESERLDGVSSIARETLARIRPVDDGGPGGGQVREGRLLVVDDNPSNRNLMARQLARQGYSVALAEGGREALDMLGVQDFDLVLLDILMPEVDGIEVLRRLRSDPALRDIPVIMTSSLDEVDSAVRCLEAGADDYIARPVEPAVLRARVAARLQTQRMRSRYREQREQLAAFEELFQRLLTERLPGAVADRVVSGDTGIAEDFREVTVLSLRIAGTDAAATRRSAVDFVRAVGQLVGACREIAKRRDIEAVFPRGSGLLAAAGIPASRPDHAEAAAETALDLMEEVSPLIDDLGLSLRLCAGMHTGRAVAGMVGGESLHYDLWGEAPELAQELASGDSPGAIRVSSPTYALLRDRYRLRRRGVAEVADGTQMQIYLLEGRQSSSPSS